MSLNRRRHTANVLSKANQEFALCVPIAGMEDLILAVGSTSGKFGCKFIENHTEEKPNQSTDEPNILSSSSSQGMSKRQKKKKQHEDWAKGIPGLARVHIGESRAFRENLLGPFASETQEEGFIFCIQGTIAHMRCRTYAVMEEAIDEEHYLVLGEVIDAFCHSDYWEASKKLFRPKPGAQPYLTFFGSQTFGRVFAAGNCD